MPKVVQLDKIPKNFNRWKCFFIDTGTIQHDSAGVKNGSKSVEFDEDVYVIGLIQFVGIPTDLEAEADQHITHNITNKDATTIGRHSVHRHAKHHIPAGTDQRGYRPYEDHKQRFLPFALYFEEGEEIHLIWTSNAIWATSWPQSTHFMAWIICLVKG